MNVHRPFSWSGAPGPAPRLRHKWSPREGRPCFCLFHLKTLTILGAQNQDSLEAWAMPSMTRAGAATSYASPGGRSPSLRHGQRILQPPEARERNLPETSVRCEQYWRDTRRLGSWGPLGPRSGVCVCVCVAMCS